MLRGSLKPIKFIAAAAFLAGCSAQAEQVSSEGPTLTEVLGAQPELTRLSGYIETTEMDADLSGEGPYTVFAPRDAAFAALDNNKTLQADLDQYPDYMGDLLSYHVLEVRASENDLNHLLNGSGGSIRLSTASGQAIRLYSEDGSLFIKNAKGTTAKIIQFDINAENGVVHLIDTVAVPNNYNMTASAEPAAAPG